MAAPTPTARLESGFAPLGDGFSTKVTFAADPNVSLWEKTVQPPGMDGGDPVDTTTMFNGTYRTMRPRSLITLTEHKFTAAYDPVIYIELLALVNVETTITVTFPDASTIAFYGYLKAFEPSDIEEGTQPEGDVTIVPTNWDATNSTEEGPVVGTS